MSPIVAVGGLCVKYILPHYYVPNNKELNGDLTDLYTGTIVNPCGTGGPANLNYDTGQLFEPSQSALYGTPFTCPSGTSAGQTVMLKQPIPGNLIANVPGLALSLVALLWEKSMPHTDAANGGLYLPGVPLVDSTNEFTVRSDYNISNKQRIFGRVFYQKYSEPPETGGTSWRPAGIGTSRITTFPGVHRRNFAHRGQHC